MCARMHVCLCALKTPLQRCYHDMMHISKKLLISGRFWIQFWGAELHYPEKGRGRPGKTRQFKTAQSTRLV